MIIGYNEERGSGDDRTGSHMLVVGRENNYTRYGGMVVGLRKTTGGDSSSVSGGRNRTALDDYKRRGGSLLEPN